MGWFSRKRKPKFREVQLRPGYADLPQAEWTDDEFDHWFDGLTEEQQWAHWDVWSRDTFDHPTITAVRRSVLDLAAEAAKASYPQEFGCFLRLEKGTGTISELVLVPGTIQGDRHTFLMVNNLPVDRTIRGTLHSHPSPHPYPSDADFALFEKHGAIHIIYGHPYGPGDWRCYDHTGTPTHLDVVEG
jgi:proteasome lid subunit RPN8/RPN11